MFRNFRVENLLRVEEIYTWILLGAQLIGAGLLLFGGKFRPRFVRWFFALQAVVFPLGVPGLVYLPFLIANPIPSDREGFVDIPFIPFVCHPVWIAVSLLIVFTMRGPGLGAAGVWHAIRRGISTAGRKSAEQMLH